MTDRAGSEAPAARADAAVASPTRTQIGGVGLAAGELLAGRYRIVGLLGVGGMGMVYRAHDEVVDLDVAVKILRPDIAASAGLRERLRRELLLGRQVSHRNVVRIHDLGVDASAGGERVFLTMDFIAGRSLADLLEQEGRLSPQRAVAIAGQLAEALAAAHAEGIVHRDLKPANVLLDAEGRPYITDFGVARSLAGAGLTAAGGIVGTLDYLSPEQARGDQVDGRSDLYALGILLFEMLTGDLPFAPGSVAEMTAQRLSGNPRDLRQLAPEVPSAVAAVVARCLQRNPARRYPDAPALLAALSAVAAGGGRSGSLTRWLRYRRPRLVAGSLALAVLALIAFAVDRIGGRAGRVGRAPSSAGTPAAPVAGAAQPLSVAVLPLLDQSGRADLAWSGRGIAELLAAALAESPEVRVIEPARLERLLKDLHLGSGDGGAEANGAPAALAAADQRRVAELVGAERIVDGVVRAVGDRVRIDLRVLAVEAAAAGAEHLEVESAPGEVFGAVATLGADLRRRLTGETVSTPAALPLLSDSPAALGAYTAGSALLASGGSLAAVPSLERAVAADAGFAAAWLRLAEALDDLGMAVRARAAATHAVDSLRDPQSRLAVRARAFAALLAGEPERAADLLAGLIERLPNDVELRIALAEALGRAGQIERAVGELRAVVARDPQHPRAWFLLGKWLIRAGDSRGALDDALVHALVVQNRLRSDQGRAEVLNAMGVAQQELGELEAATGLYGQAAELRQAVGDRRGYATSRKNLASLAMVHGDLVGAERQFRESLAILETLGDPAGIAELENALGGLEEERGRLAAALEHYRRALSRRRELGDAPAIAQSLDNVGFLYFLLGENDHATTYWQQALQLQHEMGDQAGELFATLNLARLDLVRGRWAAALRSFLQSLAESQRLALKDAEAAARSGIGRVAQLEGRYGAALDSYGQAAALATELEDARGQVEFALETAETLLEVGAGAAAETHMVRAAALLADAPNEEQAATLALLRAQLAHRRGRAADVRAALAEAATHAGASGSLPLQLRVAMATALGRAARARATALDDIVSRAEGVGDIALRLRALEELSAAHLELDRRDAARGAAAAAAALAAGSGNWARTYRLQFLLARSAPATTTAAIGDAGALERARAELRRIEANIPESRRAAWRDLPEVRDVVAATGG